MRKTVLSILFLFSMLLFASNSLAAALDLASADWSVKTPHNLAAKPSADNVVKAFMSKLDGVKGYSPDVCAAHFADLQHSDTLSLVVAENDGKFCHLFVVDETAGGFKKYGFDPAHYANGPEIKDLAGDGNLELVVPTDLTGYESAQYCVAQWPVIYAWTSNGYSDVSSHYKGYYEQLLASLQKDIGTTETQAERAEQGAAAQGPEAAEGANSGAPAGPQPGGMDYSRAMPPVTVENGPNGTVQFFRLASPPSPQPPAPPSPDRDGLQCTKAEAAKIERFLGISRDAGMNDAIKLANSDDADDRAFAAFVFADIATLEAMRYLRTLSHDPDRGVAFLGKYGLEHGPAVYKVDRQPLTDAAGKPI